MYKRTFSSQKCPQNKTQIFGVVLLLSPDSLWWVVGSVCTPCPVGAARHADPVSHIFKLVTAPSINVVLYVRECA